MMFRERVEETREKLELTNGVPLTGMADNLQRQVPSPGRRVPETSHRDRPRYLTPGTRYFSFDSESFFYIAVINVSIRLSTTEMKRADA